MMDEQKFREDLYYRLNEIHIEIPLLRERRSDIPILTNHFLHLFSSLFQKNIKTVSEDVLSLFMNHKWPGNIQEMKNVLKASVILTDGPTISLSSLPEEMRRTEAQKVFLSKEVGSLDGLEKQYITKLLWENDWNKTKTALKLNISRPTLNAKIK
jgi:transcriptional regulator with PAS, ATPase and Fis domain